MNQYYELGDCYQVQVRAHHGLVHGLEPVGPRNLRDFSISSVGDSIQKAILVATHLQSGGTFSGRHRTSRLSKGRISTPIFFRARTDTQSIRESAIEPFRRYVDQVALWLC